MLKAQDDKVKSLEGKLSDFEKEAQQKLNGVDKVIE